MRPIPPGTIEHSPCWRRVAVCLVACAAMSTGLVASPGGISTTAAVVGAPGGRPSPAQGHRVVDVVSVGDPRSERDHEYAGEDVTAGAIGGTRFVQTRGWLRYSLTTYDDTAVTVRCTLRGSEGRRLPFELLVEGRSILTHTFVSASAAPSTVDLPVPMSVTRGKTVISVMIRAVNGPTPGLINLQIVQEHLERPAW
ncbi:MAG: DUF6805 domain-containing protein [Bacteroidales bacterium]